MEYSDGSNLPVYSRLPAHPPEGKGFVYQMQQFQEERIYCALVVLKNLEKCIRLTLKYTKERSAFGKPLLENQAIQFKLAELQTEVEALRALCYQAVERHGFYVGKFLRQSDERQRGHCNWRWL